MGMTTVGLNHLQDTEFNSGTQVASNSWFIGLINNSPTPTLAIGDTLASHAGWSETTGYSGNRKAWGQGASAAGVVTNASTANYAITGSVTVYGLFLCSASSGTSGVLFASAAFSGGTQAVANGDTLQVTLTVTVA